MFIPPPHSDKVDGYTHFDHSLRLQNAPGIYQILVINSYFVSSPLFLGNVKSLEFYNTICMFLNYILICRVTGVIKQKHTYLNI